LACDIKKKLDAKVCSFGHLILTLSLHYRVKCHWSFVMISGQLARSPVLCAARRCALCVLMHRPAGRWIRWAAGDCFKGTII